MTEKIFDFQWVKEDDLDPELCREIIERFESDPDKYEGVIGHGQVDKQVKDSTDAGVIGDHWKGVYERLTDKLEEVISESLYLKGGEDDIVCSGFQVQKTKSNSEVGFTWHIDTLIANHPSGKLHERIFTFIWYLNDDFEEGGTQFNDCTIMPKTGQLLTFVPGPTMIHRGLPPKNGDKYILTGWLWKPLSVYTEKE